jgi:thiol-disulfide isomerase/thioredoxin
MRKFWFLAIVASFVLAQFATTGSAFAEAKRIDLQGIPKLTADLPVLDRDLALIYVWASWCSDCKAKLKGEIQRFSEENKISLALVSTDRDSERGRRLLEDVAPGTRSFVDSGRKLIPELKLFSVPSWALGRREPDGRFLIVASGSGGDLRSITEAIQEARK